MPTDERVPLPTYGVWIPTVGWLKTSKGFYADYNKTVAQEIANRYGRDAKVYFIDTAIADLEASLLEAERLNRIGFMKRIHEVLKVG
jgi:hypothetical protein